MLRKLVKLMVSKSSPLIFERSKEGRYAYSLPQSDINNKSFESILDDKFIRKEKAEFPEVAELDLVRHYTELSNKNFGVDSGFYPLGSCTMKYNPKINEKLQEFLALVKHTHYKMKIKPRFS